MGIRLHASTQVSCLLPLLLLLPFAPLYPVSCEPNHAGGLHEVHLLRDLVGSRKGDRVPGLHHLRQYLCMFGYLESATTTTTTTVDLDYFDDELESAIKTYQENFHLSITGEFDAPTADQMEEPRCGLPDVEGGVNLMRNGSGLGPQWAFFPGSPKWRPTKRNLTWAFIEGAGDIVVLAAAEAFEAALEEWASNTDFTFRIIGDYKKADIKVGFYKWAHGDNMPFDGPGKVLAHAFAPESGVAHFDLSEDWSVQPTKSQSDLQSVGLHEFGHILGLAHSKVREAVMWPFIPKGSMKRELHPDDVQGIQALYP